MTVLVFERAREVRVPGAGGPVGSHECTPGSCAHQHYFANIYVCRTTGARRNPGLGRNSVYRLLCPRQPHRSNPIAAACAAQYRSALMQIA